MVSMFFLLLYVVIFILFWICIRIRNEFFFSVLFFVTFRFPGFESIFCIYIEEELIFFTKLLIILWFSLLWIIDSLEHNLKLSFL